MERKKRLLCACEQGHQAAVQALLDQDCQVDCPLDDEENTPLQVAAANGNEQVVRLLIMRGAALDKSNIFGWTPLLQAARYGHTNVVALLVQYQADVHVKTRFGASAMTLAAKGGHFQTVKFLIDSGLDLNSNDDGCEFTPVLVAVQHGHDAVLRVLLDKGSDVNFYTPSTGLTPLMIAALNGHMTTAQIIIERGGDPNVTNVCDKTALEIAISREKKEVGGYLDRKTSNKPKSAQGEIKSDIIEAAKHGDLQRVREILEQDLSQRDAHSPHDGATPLMFAAMTGRLDISELLVMSGCDVNKQDLISGWTALMQATYHGKKNVAMFLLSVGADVNIQAKNGCTAFDLASLIDDLDTDMLRHLAAKAMQVNKVEKAKKTNRSKVTSEVTASLPSDICIDAEGQKSGLKGWWNRMSNRFRNLKLGRTFTSGNRLAPLNLETSTSVQDLRVKNNPSQVQSARLERKNYVMADAAGLTLTSYDSMLLETRQSASLYTLDINASHSTASSDTLKPVIPPFLPTPAFSLDTSDISPRLSANYPKYKSGDERPGGLMLPIKVSASRDSHRTAAVDEDRIKGTGGIGPANHTTTNNNNNHGSSSGSSILISNHDSNNSPNSSGGSSNITALQTKMAAHRKYLAAGKTRPNDSTPNSDFLPGSFAQGPSIPHPRISPFLTQHNPSRLFMPRKPSNAPSAFRSASNTTSPNSSTSGSSSITPQRSSRGRSTSSKGSTTSTLTPSPSPTPGKSAEDTRQALVSLQENDGRDDELASIMKKLSLEKYNPIFEEQEVDMEAFLTLTDSDLQELGIGQSESRQQILSAISDLRSGKGRERQQYVDTMSTFNSTLKARITSEGSLSTEQWDLAVETDPHVPSTESRMS